MQRAARPWSSACLRQQSAYRLLPLNSDGQEQSKSAICQANCGERGDPPIGSRVRDAQLVRRTNRPGRASGAGHDRRSIAPPLVDHEQASSSGLNTPRGTK